jgi:DNA polymerase
MSNVLVVGDYKNIESVLTAWSADEEFELVAFREAFADTKNKAKDVYNLQWSKLFGMRPQDVTETERQGSKVVKLAFGFGGGVGAIVTMAANYQLELAPLVDIVLPRATPEQLFKAEKAYRRALARCEDWGLPKQVYITCDVLKQAYRATNTKIHQLKLDVDKAVKDAVREPNQRTYRVGRCDIWCNGSYLIIQLPSGRRLLYASPKLVKEVITDPEGKEEPWTTWNVWYSTARGKQWRREKSWSGLFVENIIQGMANDVLRNGSENVHRDTLSVPAIRAYLDTLPAWERTAICLRVHDEIAIDVPEGSYSGERLGAQMTKLAPWMEGLPLAVDTWENFRYGKR